MPLLNEQNQKSKVSLFDIIKLISITKQLIQSLKSFSLVPMFAFA